MLQMTIDIPNYRVSRKTGKTRNYNNCKLANSTFDTLFSAFGLVTMKQEILMRANAIQEFIGAASIKLTVCVPDTDIARTVVYQEAAKIAAILNVAEIEVKLSIEESVMVN